MSRLLAALITTALCLQCSTPPAVVPVPPLLVELSSPDPAVSNAAGKRIEALPEAERIQLLLRGLRLEHRPAAVWCAARLEWNQVNAQEARLLVELLTPELFKDAKETDVDFDEFRYNLASDELGPILRRLATAPVTVRPRTEMFVQLHRQVRPEHYPILCDIYSSSSADVASAVMEDLEVAVMRTLRHKEIIGHAILQRRFNTHENTRQNRYGLAEGLTPWQPDPNKKGYTSLLHDLLEEFFTTDRMEKSHERFKKWLFRWSVTERPADVDRPLLLDMLGRPNYEGQLTALHGLRRLGGTESRKPLQAWLEGHKPRDRWDRRSALCLMALERCGDPGACKKLLELAKNDYLVVGLLARHDVQAAVEILCEPMTQGAEGASQVAEALADVSEGDLLRWGCFGGLLPDAFYRGVDQRLQASSLPGAELARICQGLPNPSRQLVLESARRLARAKEQEDYEGLERFFSLLEVTDIERMRGVLRAAVRQGNASACKPLFVVAEEQDVPALVRWLESGEETGEAEWADLWFSDHPEVRQRINQGCDGETLDSECVLALGHYHGLPPDFFWDDLHYPEYGREVVRLFRAGKPIDAILLVLEHQPDRCPSYQLGKLQDPRIAARLRLAQQQRYRGSYWVATQALARQGDASCRRTVDGICRMGRYCWIEEISSDIAIPAPDPDLIRFWASELETNCCRASKADNILQHRVSFFGRDDWWDCHSAAGSIECCLRRCNGQLAWSRLVKKFVPIPQ